jgi:alkylhydroperoxidase family enzyme
MANIETSRRALVARILDGDGDTPPAQRRAAFDDAGLTGPLGTLIGKVAQHAHRVTDEDFAAVRAAGLTEDQIYELVVCAAVGEATRQLDAGLAALAAATKKG